MKPRTVIVAIDVPEIVTDIDLARRIQSVLRQACVASGRQPGGENLHWPDPKSIEVTVVPHARDELFPLPQKD